MTDISETRIHCPARWIDLERHEARQTALEDAARALENKTTNELYRKALKMAAALIRSMKHEG